VSCCMCRRGVLTAPVPPSPCVVVLLASVRHLPVAVAEQH
jgi:hypothetical protein